MNPTNCRRFSFQDQIQFAELSGDWNPIHVDPIFARRSPHGQIVHGIHSFLWALETFLGKEKNLNIGLVKVLFLNPINLHEELQLICEPEERGTLLLIKSETKSVMSIRIVPGTEKFVATCIEGSFNQLPPDEKRFVDLKQEEGTVPIVGNSEKLNTHFPNLFRTIGSQKIAALISLSRVVGMKCPGLNSMFSGLEVSFFLSEKQYMNYRVVRHSIPNAPVRMFVEGGGLTGHIDAFVRPSASDQVRVEVLKSIVSPTEFSGQNALVIGGSRGLGEVMSKIISVGGGKTTITYSTGENDAQRVVNEILGNDGFASYFQLDISDINTSLDRIAEAGFTHVYYFATPPIRTNRSSLFNERLFKDFCRYYVTSFYSLCQTLAHRAMQTTIFYPSTIYLEQKSQGFAEYIAAKAAGEALCFQLSREFSGLSIRVERLPRMNTDQTVSLVDQSAVDPQQVLLKIARQLYSKEETDGKIS